MNITRMPFDEVFADESGGNIKTPQSEYLREGRFPVIDQGKTFIAGYVDDEARVCGEGKAAIIFGDHTRCVKYIDRPFCMGADGVKVLRPKIEANLKYLYYYLKQLNLPDAGYDRHFKYLKRTEVVLLPLPEQRRIAAILDQADALRAKRREALAQLDRLTQAIFVEMFGDPVTNPKEWPLIPTGLLSDVQGGLQVTSARSALPVEVPYLRVANVHRGYLQMDEIKTIRATPAEVKRTLLAVNDLLVVEGHGNPEEIGRSALWTGQIDPCIHQNHLIRVRFDSARVVPVFACAYLNSPGGRQYLLRSGKTTSGLNTISVSNVRGTPVALPPIDLQQSFAAHANAVERMRVAHKAALADLDALFTSLQHRAFRGEL